MSGVVVAAARRGRRTFWFVLLSCLWFRPAVALPVAAIEFSGNLQTKERILRQELLLQPGEPLEMAAVEASRQALMDLGLFRQVESSVEEREEGAVVRFTVVEKRYFLPLPRLDAEPSGDYSYGMEMRVDNLAGLNQRVRLVYDIDRRLDGEAESRDLSLEYRYPRMGGSRYNLGTRFSLEEEDLVEEERLLARRTTRAAALSLSRWLTREGPSRGWRLGGGFDFEDRRHAAHSTESGTYADSRVVQISGGVEHFTVHEYPYHREGQAYGYRLDLGLPELGSDWSYNRHLLSWRRYQPLPFAARPNLNWRLQVGMAGGARFGASAYRLGGDDTLRGYEGGYAEGNAMILLNSEYLHPINGYRQLRGVLFMDLGNAWSRPSESEPLRLHPSAGIGLRWKVQSFVDFTLTADYAWGIDADSRATYLHTSGTF